MPLAVKCWCSDNSGMGEGFNTWCAFLAALFLGPIATYLMAFLPANQTALDNENIQQRTHVRCSFCGSVVLVGYPKCPYCKENPNPGA